jgi:hypothetical protein
MTPVPHVPETNTPIGSAGGLMGERCEGCGCTAVAIMIRFSESCLATLRSCEQCGDSWDLNGARASRELVHVLIPRSTSPFAICHTGGQVRPSRRGQATRGSSDRVARHGAG